MKRYRWMMTFVMIWIFAVACDDSSSEQDSETADTPMDSSSEENDSETDSETDSGTATDTEDDSGSEVADTIIVKLNVPADFDGNPELLAAMFFTSSAMEGMPNAFGQAVSGPGIVAGQPFEFEIPQTDLSGNTLAGTYYLALTLYCEGGGGGQFPVEGVDWVAGNGEGLVLGPGTGAVDGGEMTLMKIPESNTDAP